MQDAFRIAGGARREAHPHDLERIHPHAVLVGDLRRLVDDAAEAAHVGRIDFVDAHDHLQIRQLGAQLADHRQIVEAFELTRADVDARLREFQDVFDLDRTEIRADLVGDRADQFEREEHDRKLDAVRQLQRDNVAALDTLAAQELGEPLHFGP